MHSFLFEFLVASNSEVFSIGANRSDNKDFEF